MINQLRIRNFQSLGDISLSPGNFTVIVGESDLGKSAVIRAIKSLIGNRSGQDFIRFGQSKADVAIKFNDGAIAWVKDGQTATYKVAKDGKTESFTKFGKSLPEEISDFVRLGDVEISGEKVNPNLHEQFNLPFLVTENPSTRAKLLGELSGVNILYLAVAEARRREQAQKRYRTTRISDLETIEVELRSYDYLPNVESILDEAKKEFEGLLELDRECRSLVDLRQRYDSAKGKYEEATQVSETHAGQVSVLRDLMASAEDVEADSLMVTRYRELRARVGSLEEECEYLDSLIKDLHSQLSEFKVCPVCGSVVDHERLLVI